MKIVFIWLTYCSGVQKWMTPKKRVGSQKSEKETSGCFESVINQLRIFKNLQNDSIIMNIVFSMANILFWGPKND